MRSFNIGPPLYALSIPQDKLPDIGDRIFCETVLFSLPNVRRGCESLLIPFSLFPEFRLTQKPAVYQRSIPISLLTPRTLSLLFRPFLMLPSQDHLWRLPPPLGHARKLNVKALDLVDQDFIHEARTLIKFN